MSLVESKWFLWSEVVVLLSCHAPWNASNTKFDWKQPLGNLTMVNYFSYLTLISRPLSGNAVKCVLPLLNFIQFSLLNRKWMYWWKLKSTYDRCLSYSVFCYFKNITSLKKIPKRNAKSRQYFLRSFWTVVHSLPHERVSYILF